MTYPFSSNRLLTVFLAFASLVAVPTVAWSQPQSTAAKEATTKTTDESKGKKKPHDAVVALKRFITAPGIKSDVFAADPQVANPVSFCIDEKGRVFVCETYRQKRGVEDNRDHEDWVDDDLAAKTVQDRLAYFKKHLGKDVEKYTKHEDRIRMLVDRDGNGRADVSYVFRGGFTGAAEGTGAGVLARKGTVYYACIPRLWAFRDEDNNGRADKQLIMHEGFGVRVAFRGHDLHGLCLGPDGRIYFSIGDRGYHVKTENNKFLANPESGAVFRCEQDGSGLEVVATGLRNPQELAFDELGNLFTGDNNSDSGDLARWVHVLEGADCGWRMAFQYLADRGPWNRLRLWEPYHKGQPAFVLPPVENIGDGPSGIAYYPGTGLADHYIGNFFMCDFRGEASQSGIRTFKLRPKGATFELIDRETFLWNCLATDIGFGPDGAVYVSDWVEGWDGTGKGRIYRFTDKNGNQKQIKEVQKLLAEGMTELPLPQLKPLLEHPDYRIRLEAELELALRGSIETFQAVLDKSDSQLARLHCTWGLGMVARRVKKNERAVKLLLAGLRDIDPVIRAASAKMLADANFKLATKPLTNLLNDKEPQVQYQAALALGRLKATRSVDDLIDFAALIPADDVALRHAAMMGLAGTATEKQLVEVKDHSATTARIAAVLALRRKRRRSVAEFLDDKDPYIAREAALAINDVPINDAMPALAAALKKPIADEGFARRALNANFRLGESEHALAVAEFATDAKNSDALRNLALDMLDAWTEPSSRDAVLGMWRPLEKRDPKISQAALKQTLPKLLRAGLSIRSHAARLAGTQGIDDAGPMLTEMLWDKRISPRERAGVLLALGNIAPKDLDQTLKKAVRDDEPRVRAAARILTVRTKPDESMPLLEDAIRKGTPLEKRSALTLLPNLATKEGDILIKSHMEQLVSGKLDPLLQVDTLAASQRRVANDEIKQLVERYNERITSGDALAKYRVSLEGGDAERGEKVFRERVALSCVRCHKINDKGGEVGPDLTHVAKDKSREYLLQSIVAPSDAIAKGYESVVLFTDDGRTVTGILKGEDDNNVFLMSEDERSFSVPKDTIEERETGKSAMPDDLIGKISLFDLRDLIEYLASLK